MILTLFRTVSSNCIDLCVCMLFVVELVWFGLVRFEKKKGPVEFKWIVTYYYNNTINNQHALCCCTLYDAAETQRSRERKRNIFLSMAVDRYFTKWNNKAHRKMNERFLLERYVIHIKFCAMVNEKKTLCAFKFETAKRKQMKRPFWIPSQS